MALSCLGILYVFGGTIVAAVGGKNGEPPVWIGLMLVFMGVVVILLGWGFGGLTIWAGRCLATKRHYVFCIVMAAISCLSMPFGTALGVFTLIVLGRPSVKQLFSQPPAAPAGV